MHTFGRHGRDDDPRRDDEGRRDDTGQGRRYRADDEPAPWAGSTPGYGGRRRAPDDDGTGQWERLTDTGQYVRTATTGDWDRLTDSGVHARDEWSRDDREPDPLTDSGIRAIKWDRLSDTGSHSLHDEAAQDRFDAFWTGHRLAGDDPRWVPTPSSAPRSPAITYPERRRPDEPPARRELAAPPRREADAPSWRDADATAPARHDADSPFRRDVEPTPWRDVDAPPRRDTDSAEWRVAEAPSRRSADSPSWLDDEPGGRRERPGPSRAVDDDLEPPAWRAAAAPAVAPRPPATQSPRRRPDDTGARMRVTDTGARMRVTDTDSRLRVTDTGARRLSDTGVGRISDSDPGWGTDPGRRRAPEYDRVPRPRSGATTARRPAPAPARRRPSSVEDLETETTSVATVLLYTLIWYALPVLGFATYLLTLDGTTPTGCVSDPSGGGCDSPRGHAIASLLDGVPLFGVALGASLVFAFVLRWLGRGWRAGSIGLAAAIVGGGLSAVLYSAVSGQPIG